MPTDTPEPSPAEALRQIATGSRSTRAAGSFAGAELSGIALPKATLRGIDLSGADLAEADLTGASCGGINLAGARIEQTRFESTDLTNADLTEARAGQAWFTHALLEDAKLDRAALRFAHFDGAVLDGASLTEADLWGAAMARVAAERANLCRARLDEVQAPHASFAHSDLSGASLRRADFSDADLRGANLRDAVVDGACFARADLSHAALPFVTMTECDLTHVRLAGAWLERTRMRASQFGGAVGEEVAGEYAAAYDAYTALELNFRSLGSGDEESWAYRRRRRMGKLAHRTACFVALRAKPFSIAGLRAAAERGGYYLVDGFVEWLSDYGESLTRVMRAACMVLLIFAVLFWATGSLVPREDIPASMHRDWPTRALDYLLFSLNSMTTVGPGQVELRPAGELAVLLSSLETVLGTVLIGLFGFVLGARMRR